VLGTGWPFVSLWSGYELEPSTGYWWYKARDGIKLGDAPSEPGDVGAALAAGASVGDADGVGRVCWECCRSGRCVWGAVVVGPGVVKRAVRRRRGLCVVCGYDRRGLDVGGVCPECGGVGRGTDSSQSDESVARLRKCGIGVRGKFFIDRWGMGLGTFARDLGNGFVRAHWAFGPFMRGLFFSGPLVV
jgi:hypothetical protein